MSINKNGISKFMPTITQGQSSASSTKPGSIKVQYSTYAIVFELND